MSIWPPLPESKARAMVTSLALALASDYDKTNAEFYSLFQKTFRMKQGLNIESDSKCKYSVEACELNAKQALVWTKRNKSDKEDVIWCWPVLF